MELKTYISNIKVEKNNLYNLVIAILKTEETLTEKESDIDLVLKNLSLLLKKAFQYVKEYKIEISNKNPDLDLDNWKNNIHMYKVKNPNMNKDVFLYSIRNSLMYLLEVERNKTLQKAYIFEIIIKTFLFINFLNLSIDSLLAMS